MITIATVIIITIIVSNIAIISINNIFTIIIIKANMLSVLTIHCP